MDTKTGLGEGGIPENLADLDHQADRIGGLPWLSIWVRPRVTIRRIVTQNPEYGVLLLGAFMGISGAFSSSVNNNFGDTLGFFGSLLFILLVGPLLGIFGLYLMGAVLKWSGGLLGGQATYGEVRAAIAWSAVPTVLSLVFNVPSLLVFSDEIFTTTTPNTDAFLASGSVLVIAIALVLVGSSVAQLIIAIWGFIIYLHCLGEVNRFSAWRALSSILIPGVVLFIPLFLCILLTSFG